MENQEPQAQTTQTSSSTNWIGTVSYLTFIGWIIALIMKNNSEENKTEFNSFHVRQSLGLILTSFALSLVNIIPVLGQIVYFIGIIFLIVCWFIGFIAAVQGNTKEVPLIGKYYQQWFKSL